jgi:RNA polymerase sigma factor (sigma-70 family)
MQKLPTKEEIHDLVRKSGSGDAEALKKFFEIYSEDIYNFPIKVFRLSEDDAGDFYIYAFERLKSGKRFKSFEGKSSFKTWFFSVLRNLLIDWKRTKREVKTQTIARVNQDGKEYNTIEDEPDTQSEWKREASDLSQAFYSALQEIKIENRIVFKLSYIYYLQLNEEEIKYIQEKRNLGLEEIKSWILEIRNSLSDREQDNLKMEDKITSIYMNILALKEMQIQEAQDGKSKTNLPDLDRIGQTLTKKYEQRRKLIERKQKGHFLARTPYKEIASLLDISEGGISVTLLRVVEKLQKKINLGEYF